MLAILDLVLDQIVECCDGTDQTAEVNCHQLIVCLDAHGAYKLAILDIGFGTVCLVGGFGCGQVGKKVEDVLEVAQDGMVDG